MSVYKRGKICGTNSGSPGGAFWSRRTQHPRRSKLAEQKRRRELEEGFNCVPDQRREHIRTIREVAKDYLESYALRNRSIAFAQGSVGHVVRLLGERMLIDITESIVREYQDGRLR